MFVTGQATATLVLYNTVEVEVPDNATIEEIKEALQEVAESHFAEDVLLSSDGPELQVSVEIEEDEDELEPTIDKDQKEHDALILTLSNGYTLHSGPGDTLEIGGYIRFCNPEGKEVNPYYDKQEWGDQPEGIMGNILNIILHPELLMKYQDRK